MNKAEIYTAVYSGIQVFEMSINELTVMRRRSDSYLNATQILKLSGFDKGKRTKILEREVLPTIHEKIQGGYGKYQGTWVPLERGRELADRYKVLDLLLPIIDFDTSTWDELPEKEQLPSKIMRRQQQLGLPLPLSSPAPVHAPTPTPGPTPAHMSSPAPVPPSSPAYTSTDQDSVNGSNSTVVSNSFKRKVAPLDVSVNETNSKTLPTAVPPSSPMSSSQQSIAKKRPKIQPQSVKSRQSNDTGGSSSIIPLSPARPTIISKKDQVNDTDASRCRNSMMSIFLSEEEDHIPAFLRGAGATNDLDMDVTLDEQGHTALHWAASLARMHTAEWLISKGASVTKVSYVGETPLMCAVKSTHGYDNDCFPHMLDILRDSISLVDHAGRSALHHTILLTLEEKVAASVISMMTLPPSSTPSATTTLTTTVLPSPISSMPVSSSTKPSASIALALPPSKEQTEKRSAASVVYMRNILKVIRQCQKEHGHILNKPDIAGESPYGLATRLNRTELCEMLIQAGCIVPVYAPRDIRNTSATTTAAANASAREAVTMATVPVPNSTVAAALPSSSVGKQPDLAAKKSKKKTERKLERKPSQSIDSATMQSSQGQELVSTVQRFVDAMDTEFNSKIKAKEADVLRMQLEISALARQLEEEQEARQHSVEQLQLANTRVQQLEEKLSKSGVSDLEVGAKDNNNTGMEAPSSSLSSTSSSAAMIGSGNNTTERERQLQQQILTLQTQSRTTNDITQPLQALNPSYAKLLEKELKYKRLIAACCSLPLDRIDEFIDPLTTAIENDPPDKDFARVIGFMEKLRQHQQ